MTPGLGSPLRRTPASPGRVFTRGHIGMLTAILVAAVSLASACGPARPAAAPSGQALPAQTGAADPRRVPQALDWYFPATAAQYAAGARFQGGIVSLTSQLMSACMARSGFHIPAESTGTAAAAIWDLSQFPDFAQMRRTGLLVPDPRNASPGPPPRLPAARRDAYNRAGRQCQAAAFTPFSRLMSTAASLSGEWAGTLAHIQASPRVQGTLSGFTSCVERAGAPASFAQNFNRFAVWAGTQIQNAPGHRASVMADRRMGAVFTRCGQATETLFEQLQTPARASFLREHPAQIARLGRLVSQSVTAARHQLARWETGRVR